jgi:hypothetical protein
LHDGGGPTAAEHGTREIAGEALLDGRIRLLTRRANFDAFACIVCAITSAIKRSQAAPSATSATKGEAPMRLAVLVSWVALRPVIQTRAPAFTKASAMPAP